MPLPRRHELRQQISYMETSRASHMETSRLLESSFGYASEGKVVETKSSIPYRLQGGARDCAWTSMTT